MLPLDSPAFKWVEPVKRGTLRTRGLLLLLSEPRRCLTLTLLLVWWKLPSWGGVVFWCSHPFHDQGCFSCSYLEGQVHTSDPFLVLSKYSFILCPNKVRKDKSSHAVPSLGSEVRALAGPGVSSFRILGVSDTRPLCLQAPGHTYKILQVVPLQAPSLGLMWGDNLIVHWQHSPEPSSTASLSPP